MRISKKTPSSWDTFDIKNFIAPGHGPCLDIGCGPGAKQDIEGLGYNYIGIDIVNTSGTSVIGKAERLPFAPNIFNLVVAASSFEHFPDPWQAAREIARVLKKDGYVVVSASFLEPYHARSYFHMTHIGIAKLFESAGLVIDSIEPLEWTGPEALAQALFQFAPARWLTYVITRSTLFMRRLVCLFLLRWYKNESQKERIKEFLEEERFRFAAGIKVKAHKTI